MPPVQIAIYVVLGLALAISLATDVRSQMIYDVVTYPTIIICLMLRVAMGGFFHPRAPGLEPFTLVNGLVGFAIGFGLFLIMFLLGGMMGGDVKLMGAVGAGLGFSWQLLTAFMYIALVGGLEAILFLLWQGSLVETFGNSFKRIAHWLHIKRMEGPEPEKKYVPYGVAIALGTVWAVAWDLTHPLIDR